MWPDCHRAPTRPRRPSREKPKAGCGPPYGCKHPIVTHHVDDDGVPLLVGVQRMEDEARVDVEPADGAAASLGTRPSRAGYSGAQEYGSVPQAAPGMSLGRCGRSPDRACSVTHSGLPQGGRYEADDASPSVGVAAGLVGRGSRPPTSSRNGG